MKFLFALFVLVAVASAKIYFEEHFEDGEGWNQRWVSSKSKEAEGSQGVWDLSAGKYGDSEKGLHTTTDARFYQLTAAIPHEFSNRGKDLVLQYSVKHEQHIDCGGGYIKLHPATGMNQESYNGDTPYNIMFGPDICGSSTKKVHLIFNYKGKNYLWEKDVKCETDEYTHLYTLILHPDNTYEVQIDSKEVAAGNLKEDWDMLPPKQIKDPKAKKPADWVDEKMIADPEDKKPEGWDDIPRELADPDAKKPDDWDDELDGEWEAPMMHNPDFKGEWKPKMIDNPAYSGEWIHPMVDNPDYFEDDNLYAYDSHKYVGFELWQVKAGSIFDNILVADSIEDSKAGAERVRKAQEGEKKAEEREREKSQAEEAEHEHEHGHEHGHEEEKYAKDEL